MESKCNVPIETEYGPGVIEEMWVSELGYLMIKVNLGNRWVSFNIGIHKPDDNIFSLII
jgi:hypothetical protein